jgi:hypothetical protein
VPPLIFGVAFGNLLQGVPFHFESTLVSHYTGDFWGLLNPFALLTGVVSTSMITFHGAIYLAHRTEGDIQRRARTAALIFGPLMLAGFTAAGIWIALGDFGYVITSAIDTAAQPDPLAKTVIRQSGAWLANYAAMPATLIVPALAYLGAALAMLLGGARTHAGCIRGVVIRHRRRHRHRRRVDVPLPDAVIDHAWFQPHCLGQRVEPAHARNHALGDASFDADHRRLHELGLQGHVRQGHRGLHPRERTFRLLGGNRPCGTSPGYWASASPCCSPY